MSPSFADAGRVAVRHAYRLCAQRSGIRARRRPPRAPRRGRCPRSRRTPRGPIA